MSPTPRQTEFAAERAVVNADIHRQLEVTVLTQIRDSMALINQNLGKLDDAVGDLKTQVISLVASRYDEQIAEVKLEVERRLSEVWKALAEAKADNKTSFTDQEIRIRDHDRVISRLGLGMAISGSVGGIALGAIIVQIATQILGK